MVQGCQCYLPVFESLDQSGTTSSLLEFIPANVSPTGFEQFIDEPMHYPLVKTSYHHISSCNPVVTHFQPIPPWRGNSRASTTV